MNKLKIGDIATVVMAASVQLVLHIICVPSTCMEGCIYREFEEGTGFVYTRDSEGFAAGGGDAWWLPREYPLILQMQEGRKVSVIKGGVRAPSDPTTTYWHKLLMGTTTSRPTQNLIAAHKKRTATGLHHM